MPRMSTLQCDIFLLRMIVMSTFSSVTVPNRQKHVCGKCGITFAESHICDMHAPSCGLEEVTVERSMEQSAGDTTGILLDEMEERYEAFMKMKPAQKKKHWDDIAAATGLAAEVCRATWNKPLYSFKRIMKMQVARRLEEEACQGGRTVVVCHHVFPSQFGVTNSKDEAGARLTSGLCFGRSLTSWSRHFNRL